MLDTFQLNSVIKQNEYFWIWRSTRYRDPARDGRLHL